MGQKMEGLPGQRHRNAVNGKNRKKSQISQYILERNIFSFYIGCPAREKAAHCQWHKQEVQNDSDKKADFHIYKHWGRYDFVLTSVHIIF